LFYHAFLPPWCSSSQQASYNGASGSWIKTPKIMSQNRYFFLLSCFLRYFIRVMESN
jgi:hypothetical protein